MQRIVDLKLGSQFDDQGSKQNIRGMQRPQQREMKEPPMSEAAGTQLTRQSQELNIFHDVAKALTSSLDLDSILQTIMEKMAEYFRPDTWSLLMVDEQKDELYFAIAVGAAAEALKDIRLKVGRRHRRMGGETRRAGSSL